MNAPAPVFTVSSPDDLPAKISQVSSMVQRGLPAGPVEITLGRPGKRTLSQNAKMWPMLNDLSRQINWHGNKLTPEEWKDVMTAGLKAQKAVPGIDGGYVVIGAHTSKMKKAELADLIELMYAFGAEHRVAWSEPALRAYEQWGAGDA